MNPCDSAILFTKDLWLSFMTTPAELEMAITKSNYETFSEALPQIKSYAKRL